MILIYLPHKKELLIYQEIICLRKRADIVESNKIW